MKKLILLIIFLFSYTSMLVAEDNKGLPAEFNIEEAIAFALANNFDIKDARERIERQTGAVITARALLYPNLSLLSFYTETDDNRIQSFGGDEAPAPTTHNWSADLELEQTLYAGGRNLALLGRENLFKEAALHELDTVVNNVLLEVRQSFYQVLLASSQIDVREESVRLLEQELRSEKNRFEAGIVSEFNVLRAEVALANSRVPLIRSRNEHRIALEELARVLGIEDSRADEASVVSVKGDLTVVPVEVDFSDAINTARKQRPELRGLLKIIQAEERGVRAEQAGYLPAISAFVSYGADSSRFSDSVSDYEHGWTAGVRSSWNIFDGFATRGRVRQALSNKSLATLAYDREILNIDVEVRRSYSSLLEARELLSASQQVVKQGQESFRLAQARVEAGAATQLDLLDSQFALTEARTNQVQALYDYNLALAQLERAMGGWVRD